MTARFEASAREHQLRNTPHVEGSAEALSRNGGALNHRTGLDDLKQPAGPHKGPHSGEAIGGPKPEPGVERFGPGRIRHEQHHVRQGARRYHLVGLRTDLVRRPLRRRQPGDRAATIRLGGARAACERRSAKPMSSKQATELSARAESLRDPCAAQTAMRVERSPHPPCHTIVSRKHRLAAGRRRQRAKVRRVFAGPPPVPSSASKRRALRKGYCPRGLASIVQQIACAGLA